MYYDINILPKYDLIYQSYYLFEFHCKTGDQMPGSIHINI
jgi:hypothetical protein